MLCTLRFESRSKKNEVDDLTADRLAGGEEYLQRECGIKRVLFLQDDEWQQAALGGG